MRNPLYIPNDARGVIYGATGSGKSFLASYLLVSKEQLIVLDPKGMFSIPGRKPVIYRTPDELKRWKGNKPGYYALYRPKPDFDTKEQWNKVFRILFFKRLTVGKKKRPFIYIDELYLVAASPLSYPQYLRAVYCQGRGLGIGCVGATQRPKGLPVFCKSESDYSWCFRLNELADYAFVCSRMDTDGRMKTSLPKGHDFWFCETMDEHPLKFCITKD